MNGHSRVAVGMTLAVAMWMALLPASAWAWGGVQHIHINREASKAVPMEMKGWRNFARSMAFPGIYPDLWKGYDAQENARHYFEPDRLPRGFDLQTLTRDEPAELARHGLTREELGEAPWMIADLTEKMSEAMRTNDWLMAARYGATMGHYVGDLHMPLHCTVNFNGQETRQHGVHTRIESEMTKAFFRIDQLRVPRGHYVEDPFHEVLSWVAHSYSLVPMWLRADLSAKSFAGGRTDTEDYYLRLWEILGDSVMEQIGSAASHLASLWYTAWVNAGKPPIPEKAFEELPAYSIFSGVGIDAPETDGQPLSNPKKEKYDLIIWSVMGAIALLVIVSSVLRSRHSRK